MIVNSDDEAWGFMDDCVKLGYEGCVLRSPEAPYLFGRSTSGNGDFLRVTPWYTGEARILGVIEGEENRNPTVINPETGRKVRTTDPAGIGPSGRAGAIQVQELKTGVVFNISIGERKLQHLMWAKKVEIVGLIAKYRFKETTKTAPRFPQWVGFRDQIDMSE